jgi:uncharacterized protein YccT (UPF0319 family)
MFVSFKSNTTVSLVEQELPTTEGAHEYTTGLRFYASKYNQSGTVAAVIASKSVPGNFDH